MTFDDRYDIAVWAEEKDVQPIMMLLREGFSLYTDHLPDEQEITLKVLSHHVIVNRFEDKVTGVQIFTPTKHVCYGNVWIDKNGLGVFLSKAVFRYLLDNGIGTLNYWVKSTNKKVIKYHKMNGAVEDGLIDYSFLKNK